MSLSIRLLPEAREEFDRATDWYGDQREGLGVEFVMQVSKAFDRIAVDQLRPATVYVNIRKVAVPKYPYVVLY